MLRNSLLAIQALLGMTIVLEGTPNPRLCSVLIAATMRLAQTMGLHRKNQDPTLTEVQVEQQRRVFWIAYFLDKDINLRTGQPLAQDDGDLDVELPSETISNLPPYNNSTNTINFFNLRIGLAIIQGQVYRRMYSVKAANQSKAAQSFAAHELNAMLAAWRDSIPIDFEEIRQPLFKLQSLQTFCIRSFCVLFMLVVWLLSINHFREIMALRLL